MQTEVQRWLTTAQVAKVVGKSESFVTSKRPTLKGQTVSGTGIGGPYFLYSPAAVEELKTLGRQAKRQPTATQIMQARVMREAKALKKTNGSMGHTAVVPPMNPADTLLTEVRALRAAIVDLTRAFNVNVRLMVPDSIDQDDVVPSEMRVD